MSISVVIPIGPYPANKRWLRECLDSVLGQTLEAKRIMLIDDGAELSTYELLDDYIVAIKMPWRTGISHGFNYGVALAPTECVFMLGSDDTLEPTCLEKCWQSYEARGKADGYYSVPIKYMDTGEVQTAPCNAAMVTKGFWRMSGGFPIETSIGIGDSTLLSICLAHHLPVYWVGEDAKDPDTALYNYRRHPDIHTYKLGPWWGVADQVRSICTEQWNPSEIAKWSSRY